MSLIIIEQELIDYRIPLYENIGKEISEDIVIYYWESQRNLGHKILTQENIGVKIIGIKVYNIFNKLFIPNFLKRDFFNRKNTIVIRGNVRNPFLMPFLLLNKLRGVKTIVWGQAISRKRIFSPFSDLRDFYSLVILKISSAYVLYDDVTKIQLEKYIKKKKFFVANNTIDTQKEYQFLETLGRIDKTKLRSDLGVNSKITLLYIGRLSKRKKISYLLEVFKNIENKYDSISLMIVGQGPEFEHIKKIIDFLELKNVSLVGPKYELEAAKYLYVSDIMIMPGWLGLAVNHAFIYGLPIVSQKENDYLTNHAPEAMHLKHKFNGWFAKYNDSEDMIKGIDEIINNYESYSKNAFQYAQNNLGIDKLVHGFIEAYNFVNDQPKTT